MSSPFFRHIILLLAFCSFLIQCKSQVDTTTTPKVVDQKRALIPKNDHFFSGNQKINSSEGPSTITRNILQDSKGNFWFATWEGIVFYDGASFTNMTNKHELDRYRAFSLAEDSKENIWIGTIGAGLFKYDGKNFSQYTTMDGLASNEIGCLFVDNNETLWVGTLNGLSRYQEGSFISYEAPGGATNKDNNAIIQNDDGNLWIGTRGKLLKFDGKTFTEVVNLEGKNFYNVRSVIKASNGKIWFGGNDGLWSTDGIKFEKHSEDFVGNLFEDSDGNIFFSQSQGGQTYKMALHKYEFLKAPMRGSNIRLIKEADGQVFGITEDQEGYIWFGLENGIARYDGDQFEYFKN